jgi:hypothetical protein
MGFFDASIGRNHGLNSNLAENMVAASEFRVLGLHLHCDFPSKRLLIGFLGECRSWRRD